MNKLEKDLKLIHQHINDAENKLLHKSEKHSYTIAFTLIQEVKTPIKRVLKSNTRGKEVKNACEVLIEFLIRCGNISYTNHPSETIKLSALLNFCCYLLEEFNLSADVADFLANTYNDWYLPQAGEAV
ncbi:MAG: hypothetical protein ACKOWL_02195 [Sphingobacteriaceae bacterium]